MIRIVACFSLKEGADPGEVWKYWKEIHAPAVARSMPGLREYVIHRVIKGIGQEPKKWWGMVEQWFDSEEAYLEAVNTPRPQDAVWDSYIGERFGEAIAQEQVMIENRAPEKHVKRIGFFGLPKEADPEEAWKYWKEIHAVNYRKSVPECRSYSINRAFKTLPTESGPPKWWGFIVQRFESEESAEAGRLRPRPKDDFNDKYQDKSAPGGGIGFVEKAVIV